MDSIRLNSLGQKQISQILSKISNDGLNKGDILQGRVMSIKNSMLILKLTDGSNFTCKVPENFSVNKNDLITLEIGDTINGQLTVRVISMSSNSKGDTDNVSPEVLDVLDAQLILEADRGLHENLGKELLSEIGQKILSYDVKPTKELLINILKLLKNEPDLTTEQGTFIEINGIETNSEMLKIVQKISEHEFELTGSFQDLEGQLLNYILQISKREELLKPLIISQQLQDLSLQIDSELSDEKIKGSIINNIREALTKILLIEIKDAKGEGEQIKIPANKLMEIISKKVSDLLNDIDEHESADKAVEHIFTTDVRNKLLNIVQKTVENIHTQTEKVKSGDGAQIKSILNKFFDQAYFDAEKEISDMDILKDKAKALESIMEFSKDVFSRLSLNNQDVSLQSYKEINQALRFFSQVTTYNYVFQIPLKMNSENTTGELYVMKRKKRSKTSDLSDFTLLISLKTKALGIVESFINSRNKCITINFRVEKEDLTNLVKSNYKLLYENLMKKGFKLTEMKCRVMEKSRTGITDACNKADEYLGLKSKVDLKI